MTGGAQMGVRDVGSRPPLRGRALLRSWWFTVTLAEFAGFALPACAGALTAGARPAVVLAVLLPAGAVEGAVLGWGQASVLRRALPRLPVRRWILATSAAAVLAYLVGLLPASTAGVWTHWPMAWRAAAAAALGVVLLGSIGTAQWPVLRRHVPHAGRWVPATALAWAAGLAVFVAFSTPLWQPGQPLWLTVAIGVTGGLLMAATVAAVTGAALTRLLSRVTPCGSGRTGRC